MRTLIILFAISIFSFAEVLKFDCTYISYNTQAKVNQKENLSILFKYDVTDGTGYMEGNNGLSEVATVISKLGKTITFIEITKGNTVNITTVSLTTLKSVHSRHPSMAGTIIESQYYGECKL